MKTRWATGFTIVELLIMIAVIGILAAITIVGYSAVQRSATERSIQSTLETASTEMQRFAAQNGGDYPTSLPSEVEIATSTTLTLVDSGDTNYYPSVSAVQNGVLFATICQDLIDEGVGDGVDQGGTTRDYISGCGNWNDDGMQITGWDTEQYDTPLSKETLFAYADTYDGGTSFHPNQAPTVKNFYYELIDRFERSGGSFAITSFWDFWATPSNGGVQQEPLPDPIPTPYFCIEGTSNTYSDILWHVTNSLRLEAGGC